MCAVSYTAQIMSCFGCCCLLLYSKAFRSQGTLQPTHKHFYKYCQNSYRDCSDDEFCIIEDGKSIYNVVPIAPSADEGGQSRGSDDLHRRGTYPGRDKRSDKRGLYARGDLPGRHPHPLSCIDDSGIDSTDSSVGIEQDWWDTEHNQSYNGGHKADAKKRDKRYQDRNDGNGAHQAAQVYCKKSQNGIA